MRVLTVGNLYPPHHLGGYELMWESTVRHLRGGGHEVRVLTTDQRFDSPDTSVASESDPVVRDLRWYWRDHEFPRMSLRARRDRERHNLEVLERELEGFRPDVVSWWAMGGLSMSLIERVARRGLPATGVVVDDWLVYGPQVDGWQRAMGRWGWLARAAERTTDIPTALDLDRAARWLFVSEHTRDAAARAGHDVAAAPIAHGGIDPKLFPAAPATEWRWRLLYVGRIDPRKGIRTAVRALADLPDAATLTVVGGGDEAHRAELEALIAKLGVGKRVRFETHPRDRLADVYAAADAVLFPVIWAEPWGLVPLEAMSVGRPVVATGTGGSGEYLEHERNCLLFEPVDDPAALAAAVRRLGDDDLLRSRLVEAGRETATRFTEEAFNRRVEDELLLALG
jgi:glycosyltransferase involved in cell wall biosynthesis